MSSKSKRTKCLKHDPDDEVGTVVAYNSGDGGYPYCELCHRLEMFDALADAVQRVYALITPEVDHDTTLVARVKVAFAILNDASDVTTIDGERVDEAVYDGDVEQARKERNGTETGVRELVRDVRDALDRLDDQILKQQEAARA